MEHRIIAIFCLIDEFLKEIGYKDDKRAYISSSEILLMGYLAVSDYFIKRKIRKGVETAFSVITSKFGKVIKATSISGFLIKLKLFITAYSIDMFLKLDESKQRLAFN